jgi:hypothetical protein
MAFAVRVNDRGEGGIKGDLVELNAKALCENIRRHAAAPDRIDAVYSNGAHKSYDLWDWAELPSYAKDEIREHASHYPDDGTAEAARRYASFVGANETVSEAGSFDAFLPALNAAYMAKAENPQPGMIRISSEAAAEILARGDADVYRLIPGGTNKLSPIEAARVMRHAESTELAIKPDGAAGLDKWAKRAADNLMRQMERGERDKAKNNREGL